MSYRKYYGYYRGFRGILSNIPSTLGTVVMIYLFFKFMRIFGFGRSGTLWERLNLPGSREEYEQKRDSYIESIKPQGLSAFKW